MSKYATLDWVLSHWAHFTMHRFVCVYAFVFSVFFPSCTYRVCHIIVTQWVDPQGLHLTEKTLPPEKLTTQDGCRFPRSNN